MYKPACFEDLKMNFATLLLCHPVKIVTVVPSVIRTNCNAYRLCCQKPYPLTINCF